MYTEGIQSNIYWHDAKKEENTGNRLEYYYIVNNEEYHHWKVIGETKSVSQITVYYLPKLPDKHTIAFR